MTWPSLLATLTRGAALPLDDVRWAMREIMAGAATPAQVAAFVVALRMRGESPEEIAALVDVMLEFSERIDPHGVAVDTCGTGGDGAHTVNISTMAAVVVAASGAKVVKHGNRAASSKCGSADVLEALGVRLDATPAIAQSAFDAEGITFCFAPVFHPALRFAGPTRRELGIPTVFNLLGPLANPAAPAAQIVGVADATKTELLRNVLRVRGTAALVVRGQDGLDEVSVFAPTQIWSTWSDAPVQLTPDEMGVREHPHGAIDGGDAEFNADIARRVLGGEVSDELDGIVDAVLVNAAAALVAYEAAQGRPSADLASSIAAHTHRLRALRATGAPAAVLDRWIAATRV